MNSLREEIEHTQRSYYVPSYAIKDSVNEILLMIEKRIDENIKVTSFNETWKSGFDAAIITIKEMLK